MKKQFKIILSILISLVFVSCASAPSVISYPRETGEMMYYLIPVKNKSKTIDFFSVDFTFYVENGNVVSDTAVFSSITLKNPALIDSVNMGIIVSDEKIYLQNKSILFKEVYKKKQLLVRFSYFLDIESTEKLLKQSGPVKFFVETDDFTEIIESKDLQKRIDELRMII